MLLINGQLQIYEGTQTVIGICVHILSILMLLRVVNYFIFSFWWRFSTSILKEKTRIPNKTRSLRYVSFFFNLQPIVVLFQSMETKNSFKRQQVTQRLNKSITFNCFQMFSQ